MFDSWLELRNSLTHDEKIRGMGWALLLFWMLSITYMTRDFWFPSAFGLPPLSERMQVPLASPGPSRKKLSISSKELRLLTMEKRRVCEAFVRSTRCVQKSEGMRRRGDSLPVYV